MGPQTQTAIRNFQRDQNIEVTGKLDDQTLDELGVNFSENNQTAAQQEQDHSAKNKMDANQSVSNSAASANAQHMGAPASK